MIKDIDDLLNRLDDPSNTDEYGDWSFRFSDVERDLIIDALILYKEMNIK